MAGLKYSKYIISTARPLSPEFQAKAEADRKSRKLTIESTHLMSVDDDIVEGFFYVDCSWIWSGSAEEPIEEPHTHDFDEIIGFFGTDINHPEELNAELSFYIGGETIPVTKSCLVYVPRDVEHSPILVPKMDRSIIHFSGGNGGDYVRKGSVIEDY